MADVMSPGTWGVLYKQGALVATKHGTWHRAAWGATAVQERALGTGSGHIAGFPILAAWLQLSLLGSSFIDWVPAHSPPPLPPWRWAVGGAVAAVLWQLGFLLLRQG